MFTTILLFLGVLAFVILTHEWGHFISAKKMGMRVDEFAFGFPPRIFGIKKGETLYSFNLFPIGGFVKIFGEAGEHRNTPRSFSSKSVSRRMFVITAGVLMNFFVAFMLFSFGHLLGTPRSAYITDVVPDSPAMIAGLEVEDRIVGMAFSGERIDIQEASQVSTFIENHKGNSVSFILERGGETLELVVLARKDHPDTEGATGIQIITSGIPRSSWYAAPWDGLRTTAFSTLAILGAFGGIVKTVVSSGQLPSDISGPVGIASVTGQVRGLGLVIFLQFIGLISLNLAILNIVPFPGLDGGRFLFLIIEKLKGSPVNAQVEGMVHTGGIALLLLFIAWVTFHDISRLL